MNIDKDFWMVGYVIYVGSTSMCVNIDLYSRTEGEWENAGHANFIVQVGKAGKLQSDKARLPQISFEGEHSVVNNINRY